MTPPKRTSKRAAEPAPEPAADPQAEADAFAALADIDPLGFTEAISKAAAAALQNPAGVMEAWSRYWTGVAEAGAAALDRAGGETTAGPVQPGRKDRRFRDPAWEENPAYFGLLQSYLLASRLVDDLRDASAVDRVTDDR
ncbi:MAG TPA: hypothetical protein VFG74_13055, partial [Miltoncostaeaceae bacterium]|nr:hypothetical protein [Miltoncostaeaceae bacterium]